MKIIDRLGGSKAVYAILKDNGFDKTFIAFNMQVFRKSLSKEACLILIRYLEKHNIPYELNDFEPQVKEREKCHEKD